MVFVHVHVVFVHVHVCELLNIPCEVTSVGVLDLQVTKVSWNILD